LNKIEDYYDDESKEYYDVQIRYVYQIWYIFNISIRLFWK